MTTQPNSVHPSAPLQLKAGQKLAGCYVLDRPLDHVGGGHSIWIAQDEVLGKQVSLHFLPAVIAQDAAAREALRHEVKRSRPLIHPGVLRVYDLVEGKEWTAVAMESFSGRCLAALLEECGRFEVDEVEPWLEELCGTLEEAHRIKLTHWDLSPENIFVTPEGPVLLANFGISRIVQSALGRAGGSTGSGARLHTASPQIIEGAAPSVADDVYGVGALLFELLAGRPVFAEEDMEEQIRRVTPPLLSEVRDETDDRGGAIPPGWENVIAACLNKQPEERPRHPAEIVSSIKAYAADPAEARGAEVTALAPEPALDVALDAGQVVEENKPAVTTSEAAVASVTPEETAAKVEIEPPGEETEPAIQPVAPVLSSTPDPAAPTLHAAGANAPSGTPAVEPAPFTARPVKYYDAEEDAFSAILPRRFRFPVAVAAALVLSLFLANTFFKGSKETSPPSPVIATSDPADRAELTSVKNSVREPSAPAPITPSNPDLADKVQEPKAASKSQATPAMIVAAAAPSSVPPLDKQIADKAAALERLKQEVQAAETAQQARRKQQQAAEGAVAEAKKAIEEKNKAATVARKVSDELLAVRKKRQEEQMAADTAAQAAQQLAAEKLRAAEEARKALASFETQNRDKLAAQDKTDAELQALQQKLADQQKIADENAKGAAAAEEARRQQLGALQRAEEDLALARSSVTKAAAEEDRRRQAMDSERRKLDDEIAAMRALFEQKMKDIEDRRRQIEAAPSSATPAPSASVRTPPASTPTPTLPLMAAKTEPPPPPPAFVPESAPPSTTAAFTNSLAMKFAPVGDVLFCVWQTRVKDFEAFAKAVNLKSTAWRGPGFRQGPEHPVVNVTWTEVMAFCKWLTDKEHKEGVLPANQFYRLPYDLEWSKAVALPDETGKTPEARDMGVPDVYPWGTAWPPPKGAGNYTGEETGSDVAIKGYDDGFAWTAPVGSFPPNQLGLYDLGGNVWQWCMDSWNNESKAKVLRGASWYNGALKLSLLSSCRVHASADSSTDNYGFRIVRAAEAAATKAGKK